TLATPKSAPLRLEHREPVRSVDLSSDDERLLTEGATIVRVWHTSGGAQLAAATHNQQVKPQSRADHARQLLIVHNEPIERIWDIATGWPITPSREYCYRADSICRIVIDGKRVGSDVGLSDALWCLDTSDASCRRAIEKSRALTGLEADGNGKTRSLSNA